MLYIVSENQSITKDHILDDPMYMKSPDQNKIYRDGKIGSYSEVGEVGK